MTSIMKILVAEDGRTARSMLEAVLTKWGYEVTTVCDGTQALGALQGADAPNLAVLDWEMPGISGPDLCRKLREGARQDPLYLILLTGRNKPDDIAHGLESGADDYIAKPYNITELKARVDAGRRLLTLQNQMREREKLQGVLEMAGAVCHELNQPLQIVLGYAEMLLEEEDNNSDTLTTIKKEIDRIGELTRRIMKITRYQAKPYLESRIIDIDQSSD
ncbi:MAG: response regulator [Desulfobacterales bacterium]|nr:response regulator [Desulfobacterales bacterium]